MGTLYLVQTQIYHKDQKFRNENQATNIYQEQGLGTNTQDALLNTLAKHDSMTVEELSQALNLEREKILMIIKELLQKGAIGQNLTQKPTRFYVL